jgi:hypothetical protein
MVSNEFKTKVIQISEDRGANPNFLMSCIAYATNTTFRKDMVNPVSGSVGLIQFNEKMARMLETSTMMLVSKNEIDQLTFVQRYLNLYPNKSRTLEDMYMAIFCPQAIGKSVDFVCYDEKRDPTEYKINRHLDVNHDGKIQKGEAVSPVNAMYTLGRSKEWLR